MTSTPTNTTTNGTTLSMSTQSSTEPPAKKQRSLLLRSVTEIQRILECPVCYNTPENPEQANFCSNGHMLCDGCHKKIIDKKCPTCRSEDWNGQNPLMPLMKQILAALPKLCPFPECETQFKNEDRDNHLKNCQYRLVDCMDCSKKLPFNTFLKHLKEVHNTYMRENTNGAFFKHLMVSEQNLSDKGKVMWIYTMTEFDDQTFIIVSGRKQDYIYFQMFLHGNTKLAENYLWQIKVINRDDPRHNTSFTGEVISVDVPIANQERQNHSGTFCFAKTMVRKLICKGKDGQILSLDLAIIKKE